MATQALSDAVAGKTIDGGSGSVRQEPQADPASDGAFDELTGLVIPQLFATDFDGDNDGNLGSVPAASAFIAATDECDVHLDGPIGTDGVAVGAHHRRPQLVE